MADRISRRANDNAAPSIVAEFDIDDRWKKSISKALGAEFLPKVDVINIDDREVRLTFDSTATDTEVETALRNLEFSLWLWHLES